MRYHCHLPPQIGRSTYLDDRLISRYSGRSHPREFSAVFLKSDQAEKSLLVSLTCYRAFIFPILDDCWAVKSKDSVYTSTGAAYRILQAAIKETNND